VKAGDPLFRIDDRDRKAELKVREAMLGDAKAAVMKLPSITNLPPGVRVGGSSQDLRPTKLSPPYMRHAPPTHHAERDHRAHEEQEKPAGGVHDSKENGTQAARRRIASTRSSAPPNCSTRLETSRRALV